MMTFNNGCLFVILLFSGYISMMAESISIKNVEVNIECDSQVSIEENFRVNYTIIYQGLNNNEELTLQLENKNSEKAKLIYFSKTQQNTNIRTFNGQINKSVEDTWTAIFKPLKIGKFETPAYLAILSYVKNNVIIRDTLDIKPLIKTVKIIKKNNQTDTSHDPQADFNIKKYMKDNNPVKLSLEVMPSNYKVEDTIRCNLYVLNKILDKPFKLDKGYFSKLTKKKDFDIFFEEAVIPNNSIVELDGLQYEKFLCSIVKIVPHKSGDLTIPSIKIKGKGSIWLPDRFWGSIPAVKDVDYEAKTTSVTIHIKEKSFSGI